MLNVNRSALAIIVIITLAFIFAPEQNLNGAAHVKIYETIITKSNLIKPDTSILLSDKGSQTLEVNGTISSLVFLTQTPTNLTNTDIKIGNALDLDTARKYILFGDWDLRVNNGKVSKFVVKFEQILEDGGRFHTHELSNFKSNNSTTVLLFPNGNVFIRGMVDVKYNDTTTWSNVDVTIAIFRGKTIEISLDNKEIDNHFQGQLIYGIVKSFKESIQSAQAN